MRLSIPAHLLRCRAGGRPHWGRGRGEAALPRPWGRAEPGSFPVTGVPEVHGPPFGRVSQSRLAKGPSVLFLTPCFSHPRNSTAQGLPGARGHQAKRPASARSLRTHGDTRGCLASQRHPGFLYQNVKIQELLLEPWSLSFPWISPLSSRVLQTFGVNPRLGPCQLQAGPSQHPLSSCGREAFPAARSPGSKQTDKCPETNSDSSPPGIRTGPG